MNELSQLTRQHYEKNEAGNSLVSKVATILDSLPAGPVHASQLAGLDQFHVMGLEATDRLARFAGIESGTNILDAGSGLGGPSRYLASTYGCRVVGVDLSPSFVAVAQLLAQRTGLNALVSYKAGDLLALPFLTAVSTWWWTQHVVMNIPDRERVYREPHPFPFQSAPTCSPGVLSTFVGKPLAGHDLRMIKPVGISLDDPLIARPFERARLNPQKYRHLALIQPRKARR
jgi:SAM-dependent methyltransferase